MRTTQKAKTIQPRTQEREDLQLPALDQEDLKLTSRAYKTLSAKGMFHSVTVWLAVVGLFGQVICVPVRIKPRFQHDGHMEQDANQPTAKPGMIEETAKPHTKDSEHLRKLTDAMRTIHKTYKGHHAGDLALITAVIKNIQDNPEIIESKPVTPKVLDEKRKLETVDNLEEQNLREEEKKALMMISELEDEMERLKKELDFTK
ncbi:uncharacterized protein LOC106173619 [Lingula anatina]|uniref:Uncharacterized protein LOC106173619 n=1 Tax=Lingula anatina TaxID=7574 RepID=A0A1S3JIL3_LINAN|nr:uncharacterized protein LOC106173619 [Lingula anatina]|eukprot:XP_013410250.1 uncharacterized protein LOC106173619 [Lingula anatina]